MATVVRVAVAVAGSTTTGDGDFRKCRRRGRRAIAMASAAGGRTTERRRGSGPWFGGKTRGAGNPRGEVFRDAKGRVVRFGESDELDAIAALQTDGFYEPVMGARSALTAVDGPLRAYFESDVASTLKKKYAYAKLGRFAPLVMEDENSGRLIGVIEVSVQRDSEVMRAMGTIEGLMVTDEYAYLSCMCVESTRRRSGIATTLIRAGESIAKEWGFNLTMLHVYENNRGAMEAYERNGFATLDRPWRTPVDVIKNQQKILMAKRI